VTRDERGVREKFGVGPASIPDYLALTGDAADGFPGVPRWGAKSAAVVLSRYQHLETIPKDETQWEVRVRGAVNLARSLRDHWEDALLFRDLATLRTDYEVFADVEELRWRGATESFSAVCTGLGMPDLADTVARITPRGGNGDSE
jgi:5'-3' exonuclease